MSRQPVIKDWKGGSWQSAGQPKAVDFAKYVTEWSDTRQYAFATHQYLKRAGAENEEMARDPHRSSIVLSYTGPTWYVDFMALVAQLDKTAKGTLVHPLFGKMRAACLGWQNAKMNVEQAANLYVVPLLFVEDQLDTTVQSQQSQGPSTQQQQVTVYSNALLAASAKYLTAVTAITTLTNAATTYAAAAVASALSGKMDATLPQQLAAIRDSSMAARDAIRADPADTQDAPRFPSVILVEQVLDACRQLSRSVQSFKPTITLYTVPARVHLAKLAHQFYRGDATTRMLEIQANNPGKIPDPHGIAPGTQLLMATPTNPEMLALLTSSVTQN